MASNFSFQRLLWNIAGAEIPILEKCRTDYKRFSAIGAAIAMTSFIAFLSGTAAAWFFTQRGNDTTGHLGWAMAFGVVWATLIFCIDRSLVITLKKNPERTNKYWWAVPLGSRALLALIIAFMVSIPLELVVFEDFIAEQKYFWNENKSNTLSQNSRANRASQEAQRHIDESHDNIKRLDDQKSFLENEIASLQSEINSESSRLNHPTTQAYKDAQAGFNAVNSSMNSLQGRLNNLQHQYNNGNKSIMHQINSVRSQLNAQKRKRASYQSIMNAEIQKWNEPIKEHINELKEQIQSKEEEIVQKNKDINATQGQIISEQKKRSELIEKRDSLVDEHDKTMHEGNHFIQNFEILEYAVDNKDIDCPICNGSGKLKKEQCNNCYGKGKVKSGTPMEWYFLWLIRLLFFIIELLPTVVKIVMPIGAYDKMVYSEEKNMDEYLQSENYLERIRRMHDLEIKSHEEQIEIQKALEAEIRQKIMQKLKDAQIEIAEAAVKKWRETELERIQNEGLHLTSESPTTSEPPIEETKLKPVDIEDGVKRTEYIT